MSWTWAWARLKPGVPTFARLLATASSCRCAASMPVTEMCWETSMVSLRSRGREVEWSRGREVEKSRSRSRLARDLSTRAERAQTSRRRAQRAQTSRRRAQRASRHLADLVDRSVQGLVLDLHQALVGLVGAHELHRLNHRLGHVHVRPLQEPLVELGAGGGLRQLAVWRAEHAVALLDQLLPGPEVDQQQPVLRDAVGEERAIGR